MAGLTFEFDVTGGDQLTAALDRLIAQVPDQLAAALYTEAQIEATESKQRTPVATGALRDSTQVEDPVIESDEVSVAITVGGASAPYVIYVHENLEAFHPVGQAKFLESTLTESAPFFAARVAKRLKLGGT